MNIFSKFMIWAWNHGVTVELGDTRYQEYQGKDLRLPRLRLTRFDNHWQNTFRDLRDLEQFLESGGGTNMVRNLLVPEFKPEEI